jgi:serine/threonine-protein kinase
MMRVDSETEPRDEETIFRAARRKSDPTERAVYLKDVCGDDLELRAAVEALLAADEQVGVLDAPPVSPDGTTLHSPVTEQAGTEVGHYKLLELIGEGGFGAVYLAEQQEPVCRRVALKIIKLGMDTREVIARFEAERQALAMMDHPNIAQVHDAGATESGRPYFVMELVRGVPITGHCDHAKLTTRQRLALFIDVCHSFQHAHRRGIIHRDIKPANVLVTLVDG